MPLGVLLAVAALVGQLVLGQAENAPEWAEWVRDGGFLGAALVTIWALLTDRIVSGRRHEAALTKAERRETELVEALRDTLDRIEAAVRSGR